jgi:DNA excision repair protein ERCC-6
MQLLAKLSALNEWSPENELQSEVAPLDAPGDSDEREMIRSGLMTPFGSTLEEHVSPLPTVEDVREIKSITYNSLVSEDRLQLSAVDQHVSEDHLQLSAVDQHVSEDRLQLSAVDQHVSEDHLQLSAVDQHVSEDRLQLSAVDQHVSEDCLQLSAVDKPPDKVHAESSVWPMSDIQEEQEERFDTSMSSEEDEYVPEDMEMDNLDSSFSSEEVSSEDEFDKEELEPFVEDSVREKQEVSTKIKGRKRLPKHLDDGKLELYMTRIRKWRAIEAMKEIEGTVLKEPDKEFKGGLQVPGSIWNKLYMYQQTGVKWLWELHQQEIGGIVGDEMGLGKTIQMIAFLAALRHSCLQSNVTRKLGLGPVLIACPATVMHQWVKEFHIWWPQFRVVVLHDTGTYTGTKKRLISEVVSSNSVLLTTFEGIRIYRDSLLPHMWEYVVLDEGHKIRNPDAVVTLVCKQFRTPHRIILSGSPMQNNLKELWSLFDFVFPGKLGTLPVFMEEFSVPIVQGGYANASQVQVETAYRCACVLRDSIKPYLLRRVKADVKLQLPKKNEQVLFCRLTTYQRELYEDFLRSPEAEAMMSQKLRAFSGLTTLRKLCNHPDLVVPRKPSSEEGHDEGVGRWSDTVPSSGPLLEDMYGHWTKAGKMVVVEALLRLWAKQHHRVLLFTQTKQMLDVLEQFAIAQQYVYRRMDGTTPISSRQPLIAEYNNNASIFVFLLTTRVGGLGVNLTGADRVIIYDPDWNPSTDTQARERAWRIGQTKPVTVYRLLTAGTIEEKIYHRQIFKQYLTNRILKDPRQRRLFKSNDLMDLFTLGSDSVSTTTETSALFAGTGADVKRLRTNDKANEERHVSGSGDKVASRKAHSIMAGVSSYKDHSSKKHAKNSQIPSVQKISSKSSPKGSKALVETSLCPSEGHEMEPHAHETTRTSSVPNQGRGPQWESSAGQSGSGGSVAPRGEGEALTLKCDGKVSPSEDTSNGKLLTSKSDGESSTSKTEGELSTIKVDVESSTLKADGASGMSRNESTVSKSGVKSLQDIRQAWQSLLAGEYVPPSSDSTSGDKVSSSKIEEKDKKGKRKRRFIEVEGSVIAGVERKAEYMRKGDRKEEGEKQEDVRGSEERILSALFSKGGLHSAMHHEKLVQSGHPDYVLVESEAQRVAERAAKALQESREQCRVASWGTPTWTGQHGSAGLKKPRFGAVSSSGLSTGNGTKSNSSSQSTSGLFSKHVDTFGGKEDGSVNHSSDLLAKMRARNVARSDLVGQEFVSGNSTAPPSGDVSEEHREFLRDLRDFVALQGTVNGEATTDEILHKFSKRVPAGGATMFRSLLNQICTFYRQNGRGIWRLKNDYR